MPYYKFKKKIPKQYIPDYLYSPPVRYKITGEIIPLYKEIKINEFKPFDYKEYLKSPKWNKKRYKVFERDNFKCQKCGKRGTQAHHLNYKNIGNEKLDDLITLCNKCHKKEHKNE